MICMIWRSDFFSVWYSAPRYHHLLVFLARLCRLQTLSKWLFQILVALFLFQLQKAYFPRSKFHAPFPTLRFPSFSSFLIWFLLWKDYFCYSSFPHRILKRDDFSWVFPHWILWRDDFFRSLPHLLIYERLVSLELPSCRKRKTNTWDPIFRAGASFNFNFQLADDSTFPPWIVTIFNIYLQYSISILTIFMTLASLENNIFSLPLLLQLHDFETFQKFHPIEEKICI